MVTPRDGSGRLFVVEQTGLIWIISKGEQRANPFLDLRGRLVELSAFYDERGLLGLAFHPDFAANGLFYVSYSAPLREGLLSTEWNHTTHISEFTVSANDPNQADPASERILLSIDKPGYNYEAGQLAFGPDSYLYISTGDSVRDPASESGKYAQDLDSLLGKILRIDVNGNHEYDIPADNPFANGGGRPEIFAYGLRNPYRFSFDLSVPAASPRLYVADVGQAMMEEVDLIVAGGNYGWPIREGTTCFNSKSWNEPYEKCVTAGLIDPIIAYAHQGVLSAVIGGIVYSGQAIPDLRGGYIFGDWGRGDGQLLAAFPPSAGANPWEMTQIMVEPPHNQSGIGQLLGIGQDQDGELYLLVKAPGFGATGDTGKIFKVIPP